MRVYLVGGYVRDHLLGGTPPDRDWVVVGESRESMLARGFRQVGADFPVFIHPLSGEEYALARRERKTGPGYHGFHTEFGADVTLAQDLSRRDLTINAMAMDETGRLIDPHGGRRDLEQRLLRHVSAAFRDDPLRLLRVARFQARFAGLGFRIAPETLELLTAITRSGELTHLTPERVWLETVKALESEQPVRFFSVLELVGALPVVFPELAALRGQTQPHRYHPEGDAWDHTLLVLERAAELTPDPVIRFAALVHDLGKGLTPAERLPHHHDHENVGEGVVANLCQRLRIPNDYRELALRTTRYHLRCHRVPEMRPKRIVKLLRELDAFRKPRLLEGFLLACRADASGRGGEADPLQPYLPGQLMRAALEACHSIDNQTILAAGYRGKKFGEELHRQRVQRVKKVLTAFKADIDYTRPVS